MGWTGSLLHSTVGLDAAVSFQDSSAPSMSPLCLERPVLLPTRLWQPTTPQGGQEFWLVLLSSQRCPCRRLREDTWWACSSLERLLSNNCDHWPFCNSWTRSSNFFLGTCPPLGGLWSIILGRSMNNFYPLAILTSLR